MTQEIDVNKIGAWIQSTYESNVRQKLETFSDVITETALRLYPVTPHTPTPVYEYLYTSMATDVRMMCGDIYLGFILATSPVNCYIYSHILSNKLGTRANATFLMKFSVHGMDVAGFYNDRPQETAFSQ